MTRAPVRPSPGRERWLRRFHPAPAAPVRLVCLPHAGGSASYYFPLSRALSPRVDVVAVQYPGRQDRRDEPFLDTVEQLADAVTGAVGELRDRPVALFGHSLGATVAFEIARRLEDRGIPPVVLFVSGRRAPSSRQGDPVRWADDASLLSLVRSLGGTDAGVLDDEEIRRMVLPAIRADYRALESYRYRPGPPLRCPVQALVGEQDRLTPVDDVMLWAHHTAAAFAMSRFPGGHFFLGDNLAEVAAVVSTALASAGCHTAEARGTTRSPDRPERP